MIEWDNNQTACFDINEYGRILWANQKFCQLFGYKEDEVKWHYVIDIYRFSKDWDSYRAHENSANCSFVAKLKNRKGRSFKCSIIRETLRDEQGKLYFRNKVKKMLTEENFIKLKTDSKPSLVFLAKCSSCGVQFPMAEYLKSKATILCSSCAQKAFPEVFEFKNAQVL